MSWDIHKASVRNALKPRREPYWGPPIGSGRYLGVRKLGSGACVWIARLRDEDAKQRYKSLGQVTTDNDYNAAKRAAEVWFEDFDRGVATDKPATVADACREYVEALEDEGRGATATGDRRKDPDARPGWGAAHDANMRFRRYVYDADIGRVQLPKLRTKLFRKWRSALPGTPASQDRTWAALHAALEVAVTNRLVNPAVAQEWRDVKRHKGAGRRRELYLDLKQRRALLEACEGAVRDLIAAAALTGARPGELVNAKRSQFDARTMVLKLAGKAGMRIVPLSSAAVKLFRGLAKSKTPNARLLLRDDGKPWQHSDWDELVRDAAKKAELPKGVVLYTLRHSWITEALRSGMSTLDVARLTGTSLQMLEEHYGHLVADSARERLAKVKML